MTTTLQNRDLAAVMARLDAMDARLSAIVARQEKTDELFAEMTPILRDVMATATAKLDGLEKKGWFAFGRELAGVAERVVEGFDPREVHELGDAVVSILRTVRALTQPRVLEVAADASEVIENGENAAPLGLIGMVRATSDEDVQKGMAVIMEIMRHVGRAAKAVQAERGARDPMAARKEKLAAALGPRRKRSEAPPGTAGKAPVAAACGGVSRGADEPLVDPKAWTKEAAAEIAASLGVPLDGARWAVIDFARSEFETTGTSPNIRRLTQGTKLATKDIYALFPKAPARTVARIAGIPKPAGCI